MKTVKGQVGMREKEEIKKSKRGERNIFLKCSKNSIMQSRTVAQYCTVSH